MEYECYDDEKRPQGRALVMLRDWESFPDGLVQATHLASSDEYYEWYARQTLKEDKCLYQLCQEKHADCRVRLARGDRRELVHVQRWRLVSPLVMAESEYLKVLAIKLMKEWVDSFVPIARVPEPPGLPPPEGPSGPGGKGGGDHTGLDRIAREAAQAEKLEEDRKGDGRKSRAEAQGIPRGSVGLMLERKAAERREHQESKEKERKGHRRRKSRSRSRGRRRKRNKKTSESSRSKSGKSSSSQSSEGFQVPSTRGEEELWRLSRKHPGRLLKRAMKELQRYLGEIAVEGDEEAHWMKYRMMGYVNQIVLTQHPPNNIGVRNYRELVTLGNAVDLLLQGRLGELGDLLVQRLKALETSLGDQGWQTARHQELIPAQSASLTSEGERRKAARLELANSKLKQLTLKNRGQGQK